MSTINIIGAGLSGLALALALQQQGMTCVVYEPRPAPLNIGGAVMLSPNALRVTHALGLYDNIKSKGFNFDVLHCRDAAGNLAKTYEFGSQEKYGFQALRIYRHILIDAFVKELKTRNIPVRYGKNSPTSWRTHRMGSPLPSPTAQWNPPLSSLVLTASTRKFDATSIRTWFPTSLAWRVSQQQSRWLRSNSLIMITYLLPSSR